MSNPATCVTTALTYMGGTLVDPWKEQQMTELQARITRGTADTDEVHWRTFKQAFKDTFYNTNIKAEAYQKLEKLEMKNNNLDIFISKFKRLVTASGIDIDSHGIIHLFKKGLANGLTTAIINSQNYDPRNPWTTFQPWEDAARACNLRWKHTQEYKTNLRQGYYSAFGLKPCGQQQQSRGGGGQRLTTSQGGHYMDVNTTIATNITGRGPELSKAKKAELQANNTCFYCFKKGHRAKDCRKKQADRAQSSRSTANGQTRTREITMNDITPELVREMINGDAFKAMDEEFKLSFMESILGSAPQGF